MAGHPGFLGACMGDCACWGGTRGCIKGVVGVDVTRGAVSCRGGWCWRNGHVGGGGERSMQVMVAECRITVGTQEARMRRESGMHRWENSVEECAAYCSFSPGNMATVGPGLTDL